jgi:hypothetical protein
MLVLLRHQLVDVAFDLPDHLKFVLAEPTLAVAVLEEIYQEGPLQDLLEVIMQKVLDLLAREAKAPVT